MVDSVFSSLTLAATGPVAAEWGMLIGALLMLLLAFALVAAELFIPSHGILTAMAAGAAIASVWLAYRFSTGAALLFALVLMVATPIVFYCAIKIYPRTAVGKKVLLDQPTPDNTNAFVEESAQLEQLIGQRGVAASFLRPAGIVEIQGRRIDALSESEMIDAGTPVEVIRVSGLKVIVKAVS